MPGAVGPVAITFDMMLKGSQHVRGRKKVRQHAVMVGGALRLVTSGEIVDRETYEALLAAEIVISPEAEAQQVDGSAGEALPDEVDEG